MEKTRIAVEATGTDEGFGPVLEGASKAYEKDNNLEIILIGGKDRLPENLHIPDYLYLETADYTYFSEDAEKHKGKANSVQKAMEMHDSDLVQAVIAPGDTKGTVLYGTDILRRIKGIKMPAIAAHLPFNNVLIDAGANLQSKERHLFQNAIMGHAFAKHYIGVESPLIGLVSVGHELVKGDDTIKKARKLIEGLKDYNIGDFNFEGNCVKNLYGGEVRVTDGKTGNIMLKEAEGIIEAIVSHLKGEFKKMSWMKKSVLAWAMGDTYKNIKKEFDWKEYAVCPLLGVEGNVMICHGRSDSDTIANAILLTKKYLGCHINEKLREEIAKYS